MPSYGGVDIFGTSVHMVTTENPRGTQFNVYPGLGGVEELDMGMRGRITMVSGRLFAASPGELGQSMLLFRSYQDGIARVLIDTDGVAWPSVKLESFMPENDARFAPPLGFTRRYVARFRHQY